MNDIYVVAYDGSEGAKRAAEFAAERARLSNAQLHVVHVLEWSAYSFLTADELAERHKRRNEELTRAETHILTPIVDQLNASGVTATSEVRYGNVAKVLNEIAVEKNARLIYIAKSGDSSLTSLILGNVPSKLIQIATVPVAVIP